MKRRIMKINYPPNKHLVDRLSTCLDMCCMPHVIHDCKIYYTIYIDRGTCTWEQVMKEVNRVHSVQFKFVSNCYIKNGYVYEEV